jgi:tryptophan-rich sensory protein
MYTKHQKFEIYTIFLLISYVVEVFVILIGQKETISLYASIYHRPSWTLPLHAILPLWSLFYTLFGIAGGKIYINSQSMVHRYALYLWVAVITLDVFWPITFFYIPLPILTPILMTVLFISFVVLLFNSFFVSRIAGYLLLVASFLVLYKLIFHWTFFILNIQLI